MQLTLESRPRKFSQVYGHKGIITSLLNQSKTNTFSNAILLSGPSGTGKTTVAQLIAMSLNCTAKGLNGEPCGTCSKCQAVIHEIFDGTQGVQRLDGTSSSKIDVVDFTSLINTGPMYSKTKVFIIEEIDGLSPSAKSSLLKVLENPSDKNFFILLSMEPKSLPVSLTSRCQHHKFRAFTKSELMMGIRDTLIRVSLWDQPSIPKTFYTEVIPVLAEHPSGSFRLAISNIENAINQNVYTKEDLFSSGLLTVSHELTQDILIKLLNGDSSGLVEVMKIGIEDFYGLAHHILSTAILYNITGYVENEYFLSQTKAIAGLPAMPSLLKLFNEIHGTYVKKAYLVSKISMWFLTEFGTTDGVTRRRIKE